MGAQNINPHPPPLKMPLGQKLGEGGGGIIFPDEKPQLEMAKVLQNPVFARISVNTLLRGTLGLADLSLHTVTVALHFPGFGGCSKRIALHPLKGPCSTYLLPFQLFQGVSQFRLPPGRCRGTGVSHLHCRLSRYSGATQINYVITW